MKKDFYKEVEVLVNESELSLEDKQMLLETLLVQPVAIQAMFLDMFSADKDLLKIMAENLRIKFAQKRGEVTEEEVFVSEKKMLVNAINQTV